MRDKMMKMRMMRITRKRRTMDNKHNDGNYNDKTTMKRKQGSGTRKQDEDKGQG
jgi:hypothetical protein